MNNIRNFSIIAHIDHGKSTLADRMLEITGTIEKRKMREQVLDAMELERERGITIKMQPVRMVYRPRIDADSNPRISADNQRLSAQIQDEYILNLIDTPGHIDFSYEVSRALKAVEGSLLLVDATQGVQAQTLTTLGMAREAGITIIPVVSKVDSPLAHPEKVKQELVQLLGCETADILEVSGRTGSGVKELLSAVIERIPPPQNNLRDPKMFQALVFDFKYSNHKGVIVFVRVTNGNVKKGEKLVFQIAKETFIPIEVGTFSPEEVSRDSLSSGEIGYIVTGIKEPGIASVGETVTFRHSASAPLSGYMVPLPVVWASIYPESQDDFTLLKQSLARLKLSDSSFSYEEESSGMLGRRFRCGFLGMLHLEIITERLRREFGLNLIVTLPSITYEVLFKNGKKKMIYSATFFPDESEIQKIFEPRAKVSIITPPEYTGSVMRLLFESEAEVGDTLNFGDNRSSISAEMPLRELMRNFFDKLKSISSGFASISYEITGMREADVVRLDVLVADELVAAFSRVISRRLVEEEAEKTVEKLYTSLPRQLFTTKIQARAMGRIISSRTLSALRKDVTGYLYGGDITRKKKLWEKQKKGKAKLKERGKVNIPHDVFLKMMRND